MNKPPKMIANPRKGPRPPLIEEKDFIGAGFKKVDPKHLEDGAPKVDWDKMFKQIEVRKSAVTKQPVTLSIEWRMTWLKKFSCSMNYAAHMITGERDQLARLMVKKENMLRQQTKAMEDNNRMLQSEVTRMNEDRQKSNQHVAKLNGEVRALKKENETLKQNNGD